MPLSSADCCVCMGRDSSYAQALEACTRSFVRQLPACCYRAQGARPSSAAEPTALQRALERFGAPQAAAPRAKPADSEHTGAEGDRFRETGSGRQVQGDTYQRLLAEAEACVRARSVSPCMLKGMPGPAASPITGATPAARPITPLQLGVNAVDAAANRAGLAGFMLPAAAMPRRPASAGAGAGGRHSSLAQALAAAAAAEVSSPGEEAEGGGMQGSPHSQYDVTASNAGSVGHRGDAARAFDAANIDASYGAAGSSLPHDLHGHMQVGCTVQAGLWPVWTRVLRRMLAFAPTRLPHLAPPLLGPGVTHAYCLS
jgi:hypothetical protein